MRDSRFPLNHASLFVTQRDAHALFNSVVLYEVLVSCPRKIFLILMTLIFPPLNAARTSVSENPSYRKT